MYGIFLDEAEYCSPQFNSLKQASILINAPHHISIPVIREKALWCVIQVTNDSPDLKQKLAMQMRSNMK